ncbi:hypothetical protein [Synechococcus sp.]
MATAPNTSATAPADRKGKTIEAAPATNKSSAVTRRSPFEEGTAISLSFRVILNHLNWQTMTTFSQNQAMDESLKRKLKKMPKSAPAQPGLEGEIQINQAEEVTLSEELELRGQNMRGEQ